MSLSYTLLSPDSVKTALREVFDPEVGINIVDLGLIYDVRVDDDSVQVDMTMTTPSCPLYVTIMEDAKAAIRKHHPNMGTLDIKLVWDPPWTPERMSAQAKSELGHK